MRLGLPATSRPGLLQQASLWSVAMPPVMQLQACSNGTSSVINISACKPCLEWTSRYSSSSRLSCLLHTEAKASPVAGRVVIAPVY